MERNDSSDILTGYATHLAQASSYAPATQKAYLAAAGELMALIQARPEALLLPPEAPLQSIDKRALEIYLNHLRDARGLRPATLAAHLRALRAFFAWLVRAGHIGRDPTRTVHLPSGKRPPPTPEGEEARVAELFRNSGASLAGARLLLLCELIYGGGLRPPLAYGLAALRPDPAHGRVLAETPEGEADLPLSSEGIARAVAYLARRRDALAARGLDADDAPFWIGTGGRALSPAALARQVRAAMARAGLEGGPTLLRGLAAQHFRARGADVRSLQRFLGARRLGGLERYGARAPRRETETLQNVAETLRRVNPRREEP